MIAVLQVKKTRIRETKGFGLCHSASKLCLCLSGAAPWPSPEPAQSLLLGPRQREKMRGHTPRSLRSKTRLPTSLLGPQRESFSHTATQGSKVAGKIIAAGVDVCQLNNKTTDIKVCQRLQCTQVISKAKTSPRNRMTMFMGQKSKHLSCFKI